MEKLPIKFSIDFVGIIELQINLVNLKIIAHRITESRCPYSQGVISVKIYTIFFCHWQRTSSLEIPQPHARLYKDMWYTMKKQSIKFPKNSIGFIQLQINPKNLKVIAHKITRFWCSYSQGIISVKSTQSFTSLKNNLLFLSNTSTLESFTIACEIEN